MEIINKLVPIIKKKPLFFVLTILIYFILVILLKWNLRFSLNILIFLAGGTIGIYLIDVVEEFVGVQPSPFRSALFEYGFVFVSLFIVSSSGSFLASGLVLSIYITMILWQLGQLKLTSNLDSWYRTATGPLQKRSQLLMFLLFLAIFIFETTMFLRQFPS